MGVLRRYRSEFALFFMLFFTYAYFSQGGGPGQNSRFDLTRAVVEQGTLSIDAFHTNTFDKARSGEHYYTDKSPVLSLAAVPAYALVRPLILGFVPGESGSPAGGGEGLRAAGGLYVSTVLTISLLSALAGVLFYRVALRFCERPLHAYVIALAYALGTPAFAYSTLFMSHQFCAALLLVCFHAILAIRERRIGHRSAVLAGIGLLMSAAVMAEYPSALIALALVTFLFFNLRRWTEPIWFLAGAALPIVGVALYNRHCFGSAFAIGYAFEVNPHFVKGMSSGLMGIGRPQLRVLWQILLGPYRGLLLLSPFLLLAVPGFCFMLKGRDTRAGGLVCAFVVVAYVLFGASYYMWWGGCAMGPRHLVPMLPFLCLAVGPVLSRTKIVGAVLIVVSVAFVTAGTAVMPEFPDVERPVRPGSSETVPVYEAPLVDLVFPCLREGVVSVKAVREQGVLGFSWHHPGSEWDAFNLGELAGLPGTWSLVPLLIVWALGIPLIGRAVWRGASG